MVILSLSTCGIRWVGAGLGSQPRMRPPHWVLLGRFSFCTTPALCTCFQGDIRTRELIRASPWGLLLGTPHNSDFILQETSFPLSENSFPCLSKPGRKPACLC